MFNLMQLTIIIMSMILMLQKSLISIILPMMFILVLIIPSYNTNISIINSWFFSDIFSISLICLTLYIIMIIMSASNLNNKMIFLMMSINLILMLTFLSNDIMNFYIFFELVLIPTLMMITMKGKQPERLQAGIYLFLYTLTCSLPLLLGILYYYNMNSFIFINSINYKMSVNLIFLMAFLVKAPMYLFHLWLPKAHVEAPMEGSMILAAILLKLGGYGLIRFMPLMKKMFLYSPWLISINLIGSFLTTINCMRQKDLKALIALSSVSHMAIVIATIISNKPMSNNFALIMMLGHAFSSSALFMLVTLIYNQHHTRNISLFKGLINSNPNLTFWWFTILSLNISAPPSINLISEILMFSNILNWSLISIIIIIMSSLLTTLFSFLLYLNITHNHNNFFSFSQTIKYKNYMNALYHFYPPLALTLKLNLFN